MANYWDPITPEEMRNIEIKCEEAYDSFLKSLGYDKPPYRVICDESNNSPEDIENGVVNVTIIPSIERITVEFVVGEKEKKKKKGGGE